MALKPYICVCETNSMHDLMCDQSTKQGPITKFHAKCLQQQTMNTQH